jgi:hypothetical protein
VHDGNGAAIRLFEPQTLTMPGRGNDPQQGSQKGEGTRWGPLIAVLFLLLRAEVRILVGVPRENGVRDDDGSAQRIGVAACVDDDVALGRDAD